MHSSLLTCQKLSRTRLYCLAVLAAIRDIKLTEVSLLLISANPTHAKKTTVREVGETTPKPTTSSIMSGKGGNNKNQGGGGGGSRGVGRSQQQRAPPEPTIVTGHQYHLYAQGAPDRYVYIGKDEDTGEPEFLDYGPKSGR